MNRKVISGIVALAMLLCSFSTSFAATDSTTIAPSQETYKDVKGHWASEAIYKWSGYGVISGNGGFFRPNDSITRGEMACILNNMMDYQSAAKNTFTDLEAGQFYTDAVLKANDSGIIMGDGDTLLRPTDKIKREEAAVMIAKAFAVSEGTNANTEFEDAAAVSSWAKTSVFGLESKGYVLGNKGKYNPKSNITRAETVAIINNIVKGYYTEPGTYTDDVAGTAVIKVSDVILKGITISENLIIAEGVGQGEATLDSVTVKGNTVVRGGGENSIHIIGTSNITNIRIETIGDKLRIVVADGNTIKEIEIAKGEDIIITGSVGALQIDASNVTVYATTANIASATIIGDNSTIIVNKESKIESVSVNNTAENTTIKTEKGAVVGTVSASAKTAISGEGNVENVLLNKGANNSSVTTPNTKTTVAAGVTDATAGGGVAIPAGSSATNNSTGNGVILETPTSNEPAPSNPTPSNPTPSNPTTSVAVTGISVTSAADAITVINGETLQMSAVVAPANATDKTVTWSIATLLGGTATINQAGLLTATGVGTIRVTATNTASGVVGIKDITVVAPINNYTALGDSITYGMSAAQGHGYTELFYNNLKSINGNEGIKLINLGIPGEKSSDLLNKLQHDTTTIDAVRKAKVITISVGGNNLLSPVIGSLASAFQLDPTSATFASDLASAVVNPNNQLILNTVITGLQPAFISGVHQFSTDWVSIIGTIKALAPQAQIYATTLYNPFMIGDPLCSAFDLAITGINSIIKTPNAGYKVADVYTAFKNYQGTDPLTSFSVFTGNLDPHPTTKGHEVIYQAHLDAKETETIIISAISVTNANTVTFTSDTEGAAIKWNGVELATKTVSGLNTITVPLMESGKENTLVVEKPEYVAYSNNAVVWNDSLTYVVSPLSAWENDRTEPSSWELNDNWITYSTKTEPAKQWYGWHGKKTTANNAITDNWKVETEFELTEGLLARDGVRTSMWLNVQNEFGEIVDWSILQFKIDETTQTKGWQYWNDEGTGTWVDITADLPTIAGVYKLAIYYTNGDVVGYINGIEVFKYAKSASKLTSVKEVIYNSYSFGTSYEVKWKVPTVCYVEKYPVGAKFIENANQLSSAINTQADGQTWIIKAGIYDIQKDTTTLRDVNGQVVSVGGQAGWYMPITANNLTIIGIDHPVITSSVVTPNGAWAAQNLITVWGDNVTLKGLTITPKVAVNKSIEVVGDKKFTIEGCTFTPNTIVSDVATEGGSLYFNGAGATGTKAISIINNTFNYTSIAFDGVEGSTITISNNTWNNIGVYAIGNTYWGSPDRKTTLYADVNVNGNNFNNVTDSTKIITARLNQTFILDATNKVNGATINKNDFGKYINFNNLAYWIECKDNKVIVDGVTYETPYTDVDAYVTSATQLTTAINAADAGDLIWMAAGDYTITETINVNKAVIIKGAAEFATKITTNGSNAVFRLSAAATLEGIFINKTDKLKQHLVTITANGTTVKDSKFIGQYAQGDGEVVRAIVPNSGTDFNITGNYFESVRQPAYLEGVGTVSGNFVKNTRGWVVCINYEATFTDNSFDGNAVDIAIIANGQTASENYTDVAAISTANNGAFVENQLSGISAVNGKAVIGNVKALLSAIASAENYSILELAPATFNLTESLKISKPLTFKGAGAGKTIINAPGNACAVVSADDVILESIGFKGTWGIQVAESMTGTVVKDCSITLDNDLQRGEGALRFTGNNGAINVSGTTMNGTLWVFGTKANQDLSGILNNTINNALFTGIAYHANNGYATIKDNLTASNLYEAQTLISVEGGVNTARRLVAIEDQAWKLTEVLVNDAVGLVNALGSSSDNATIMLADGTYELASQLKILKPITIKGSGVVTITPSVIGFYEGTYSADKHLVSINGVNGLVKLENLTISNSKRTGINVWESTNVMLKDIISKDNAAGGLVVNNSVVVADNLNTSGNGWGYGVNVDNGSNPSAGAPATSFTLNSGTISETKQIVSDKGGVTIVAPGYSIFINDVTIVSGANITSWYGDNNELLDTSVNINFDKISVSEIDSVNFLLYQDTTLTGSAISLGNNLVTLLKDCAQYWEKTADTYTEVTGTRTMSSAFKTRTEEDDNGYWLRSACAATNASVPNRLVVEVVVDNVTYTSIYYKK